MFFTVDAKEASTALGQIRRLRYRGNWKRIGSSDAYWTAAFAAALVEAVDSLLLEKPAEAYELSSQGLLLAERIRTEVCPGGTEVGKRSLRAWAQAVHGSSCRACERYEEAEEVFKQALWLAGSKAVLPWAAAEVDRRYAALLLHRGSVAGLTFVNRSIERYGQHTAGRADALLLRSIYQQQILKNPAHASRDLSLALELLEPLGGPREARKWVVGAYNLNYVHAVSCGDLSSLETTFRRIRALEGKLSKNEGYRRALCTWLEGLLMAPLGATRGAMRFLNRATTWLFKHRYFHPGALCSIDRALLCSRDDEGRQATDILFETETILATAGNGAEAYLDCWKGFLASARITEEELVAFRATFFAPLGLREQGIFRPLPIALGASSGRYSLDLAR